MAKEGNGIMKFLIVGAGAVGGYFGGRLLEGGADVTFLVRENRQKKLQETGLIVKSNYGNITLPVKTIVTGETVEPYDVIILSTKAYHLKEAMNDIGPYVGEETMILPLLNGMAHYEALDRQFGKDRVIGGLCYIESTLDSEGAIIQNGSMHEIVFGERSGHSSERIRQLATIFNKAKMDSQLSNEINQELWHKYLFIATMSGITTMMRAPIGPIRSTETGMATISRLTKEIIEIMRSGGATLAKDIEDIQLNKVQNLARTMKSSMQRDMERGLPVEVDHLHGYLLEIAKKENLEVPVLQSVYANLKIYEQILLEKQS